MAISLFRKNTLTDAQPCRDALTESLSRRGIIQHEREVISQRLMDYRLTVQRAEALDSQVLNLHETIDQKLAEAEYRRVESPDVTTDTRALQELEKRCATARVAADRARATIPKLESDMEALTARMQALKPEVDSLLRDAVREDMNSLCGELLAAEQVLRAVHRRVFVRAKAYDMLATAACTGNFVSSSLYSQLSVTKPLTEVFYPVVRHAEADLADRTEDWRLFEAEAESYINLMLSGA